MATTTPGRHVPPGPGRLRALAVAASFAVARVRARPSRGLVTGLGIAIALGSLFVTAAAPTIAGDATLRRTLDDIPLGSRSVTIATSVNAATVEELRDLDRRVRISLRAPGLGATRAQVEYRALATPDGTVFRLAGIERLGDTVTLLDGRLPTSCTPQRCEVVVVGDAEIAPADIGVVVVGHVRLTDSSLLGGQFTPGPSEVVLLGDGVEQVGAIEPLALIGRSVGWVAPIDAASVRVSDIDVVLGAAARTAGIFIQDSASIDLPRQALVDAKSRASTATRRVALVAAQGVVLLAAFALLAAAGMRRHHRAARDLLRQRGATRATAHVFTTCEAAWPVVIGLLVGIPLGVTATVLLARRWQLDAGDVISGVIDDGVVRLAVGSLVVLAATAIVLGASPAGGSASSPRRWWHPTPIDALGMGALGAGALAISRGSATPATLVADGDPVIALLPIIASLIVAWIAIRIVPALVAAAAHLVPRRLHAPLTRTALGEVARRPVVPVATAGFLAAATTLGIFSLGYRSTLAAGAHDQAAFAVPFDLRLASGPAIVRPSSLRPEAGWGDVIDAPSTVTSTDVLRRGVTVHSRQVTTDTVTMIGLDPDTLTSLRGWRRDFGPRPADMAGAIRATTDPSPLGSPIPDDTTQLLITGGGDLDSTEVVAVVARVDGSWHEDSTEFSDDHPDQLVVPLTEGDAGGRLIGFRLSQPGRASQLIEHHVSEGNTSAEFFTAAIRFDDVIAQRDSGDTQIDVDWGSLGSDGGTVTHEASGVTIALRLQGSSALLAPPPPDEAMLMPAIVDTRTAAEADGGVVIVELPGQVRRMLRVAGVASRFPGAPSRFAIVDLRLAQPAFDLVQPGFGTADEVWIATDRHRAVQLVAALRAPPFSDLVVEERAALQDHISSDPLGRFTLGLFGMAALIAAILAVAATYLSTAAEAADQAPLHRALAAEGVASRALARMVRTSSIAITVAALCLGVVGALLLLRVVTRVVEVTATSTVPVPPLLDRIAGVEWIVALLALLMCCVAASALAARSARAVARGDLLREFA